MWRFAFAALAALVASVAAPGPRVRAATLPDAIATVAADPRPMVADGNLRLDIRDSDSGEPLAAKVTILGAGDTAGPHLANGRGQLEPWGAIAYHRVYASHGIASATLPPGRYDVWVSRGIEYDRAVARDVIIGGVPMLVQATLRRAVGLPGWTSADLHVHTGKSKDSVVTLEARVHQFVSDGVDVIVATDHNRITDLRPVVEGLDLGGQLMAIPGQEMTTWYHGHFGVWPLEHDHHHKDGGPIDTARASVMFERVRKRAPEAIIIANHPWMGMRGSPVRGADGYFVRGGMDPASLTFSEPGHSFGFDAIEVLNGYETPYAEVLDHHLNEWFTLLGAGFVATATGNSDTHELALNQGGYPRNYIDTGAVAVDQVTGAELSAALKQQRAFFTTGPLLELAVGDATELGAVTSAVDDGRVTVRARVWAAPWIDVDLVRVWVDGEVAHEWRVGAESDALRLDDEVDVAVAHDTFVVLTAVGSRPLWPVVGERSWACAKLRRKKKHCKDVDVVPMAVTNPIFVDVDGNGVYDAPRPPSK